MFLSKKYLDIFSFKSTTKTLILYIFIAFFFSLFIRLLFFFQIYDNSSFFYNGHIIAIWNPDSALYGFYAKELLDGVVYPLTSEYIPGYLIYWIVKFTGLDIANVIFFAPAFFSSLIVVPIILIAKHYNITKLGFYSALLGSVMIGYYYRTHLGYYDTDILNVVLPLFLLYFMIRQVDSGNIFYFIPIVATIILFYFWYHSSKAIIATMVIVYILYISIFLTKKLFVNNKYKIYIIGAILAIIVALFLTDFSQYYSRAEAYIDKSSVIDLGGIKLKATLSNVQEAQPIDIFELANKISGGMTLFILAFLGYIALLIRYRSMLLSTPLVLLSLLSMVAGVRFTIYGVMLFSFGLVFGVYIIGNIFIQKNILSSKISDIVTQLSIVVILIFSLSNTLSYNRTIYPLIFSSNQDLDALKKLKENSKKGDFVLTWWDYGWPLWYYTGMQTLIDNGKHHEDNYIVSKILLSNSNIFVRNASIFFIDSYIQGKKKGFVSAMRYFNSKYKIDYLKKLKDKNFVLPKKKRDIYILLHQRMIPSLISIEMFSNLNPTTGKVNPSNISNIAYLKDRYSSSNNILYTTNSVIIDTNRGLVKLKGGVAKVKKISIVENEKLKFEKNYSSSNNIYILINNRRVFLIKPKIYNSFLVQALLFNRYNKKYFTEIVKTKNFLILKINDK